MRFYDKLMQTFEAGGVKDWNGFNIVTGAGRRPGYEALMAQLRDEETKRILFDCEQAAVFWDVDEGPPDNIQQSLLTPYHHFYLEFTRPVDVAPYRADDAPTSMRAILVRAMDHSLGEQVPMALPVNLVVFFDRPDGRTESHSFSMDLAYGNAVAYAGPLMATDEPSTFFDRVLWADSFDVQWVPDEEGRMPIDSLVVVRPEGHPEMGRVERLMSRTSLMISWLLTYMMAKSIEVVSEPIHRAERRRLEKAGRPNPWHVVRVKPELRAKYERGEVGAGTRHGHQYDVMGHLRFVGDRVVWVQPHRRGLANDVYIPKTGRFDRGYVQHPDMAQWWGLTKESV